MAIKAWHVGVAGFLGWVTGIAMVLGIIWGLHTLRAFADDNGYTDPYGKVDPGARTGKCAGADVVATAVLVDGDVVVTLSVDDDLQRTWEMTIDEGDPVTARPDPTSGDYPVLRQVTGDLDGGPSRIARARVIGTPDWCDRTVSLT